MNGLQAAGFLEQATKRLFTGVVPIRRAVLHELQRDFFIENRTNVTVERISENMLYVHNNRRDVRERWMQGGVISASKDPVRFSRGFVNLHPSRSMVVPSFFATSRRLFSSQSPEHESREIYHPCIGGIFQYGFESHIATSSFLNAVLGFKGEKEIQSVKHIRKDIPMADSSSPLVYRFATYVRCRTKDGYHFLAAMQNDFRDDYHLQSLIEHSRKLGRLGADETEEDTEKRKLKNKGDVADFWKEIKGVYTIIVTNKTLDCEGIKRAYSIKKEREPFLVNPHELCHTEQLDRGFGDIPNKSILLMLDHLDKPASELSSPVEDWAYVLKDTSLRSVVKIIPETKELEDIERIADRNPGIREFIERLDVNNLPFKDWGSCLREIRYYNGAILDIKERQKKEALLKAARAMKKIGKMTDTEIAANLGLSPAEADEAWEDDQEP